jgi:hypothetical protein
MKLFAQDPGAFILYRRTYRVRGIHVRLAAEKVVFPRVLKNAQMQGSRNPEGGVATNKERLVATPASW